MTLTSVLLPLKISEPFSYDNGQGTYAPGTLVQVPFRRKQAYGVVWPQNPVPFEGAVKTISSVFPLPSLPLSTLEFVKQVASYTLSPLGLVLKMVLNPDVFSSEVKAPRPFDIPIPHLPTNRYALSESQRKATESITESLGSFQPFLLDGVTGSGKTEVYFKALWEALQKGMQTLVLLPEIALTSQWLTRFEKAFGVKPLIWHSALTTRVRRETWKAVLEGRASVIVGARSALFLPFPKLGLIVVDEEHDSSYKQEEQVIYHGRDMAVLRAKIEHCPIVLASATPSVESVVNVQKGRYKLLHLAERFGVAELPKVSVIDMRNRSEGWISSPLLSHLEATIARGEQALMFLNRRGYAPLTLCHKCGHKMMCRNCSTWLVEHKSQQVLKCHQCDYQQAIPKNCPHCHEENSLVACGPGVERIEEILVKKFPQARLVQLTSDTLSSPKQAHEVVEKIANGEVDIIVATQIFAKGYHFEKLTLVGVIDGDLGLSGADLRACEKTYQLLHQVAGRAGRESLPGQVFIQTYHPEHPVLKAMVDHNRDDFIENEIEMRQQVSLPPFGQLAALILSGRHVHEVEMFAKALVKKAPRVEDIMVLGPIPAPLSQVRGRHRFRVLVKAHQRGKIQHYLRQWLASVPIPSTISLVVDIDPYSFY